MQNWKRKTYQNHRKPLWHPATSPKSYLHTHIKITDTPSGTPTYKSQVTFANIHVCMSMSHRNITYQQENLSKSKEKHLQKGKPVKILESAKLKKENVAKSQKPPLALPPTSPKSYLHIHICMSMSHRNIICQSENLSKSWEKSPTKSLGQSQLKEENLSKSQKTPLAFPTSPKSYLHIHVCMSMSHRNITYQ